MSDDVTFLARQHAAADKCRRLSAKLKRGRPVPKEYRQRQREGFVYFIRSEAGPVKIGWAIHPPARVKELQTAHFAKLTIAAIVEGTLSAESAYHRKFAAHRLHGEWFNPHPDILAEIERLTDAPS